MEDEESDESFPRTIGVAAVADDSCRWWFNPSLPPCSRSACCVGVVVILRRCSCISDRPSLKPMAASRPFLTSCRVKRLAAASFVR